MRVLRNVLVVLLLLAAGTAVGDDFLHDRHEVEALLKGATLEGVYLRTQSEYRLVFREDGLLEDGREAGARWWVSDQGQYCREWLTGPLAGNQGCMDLRFEGEQIQLFFEGRQVAEGVLRR